LRPLRRYRKLNTGLISSNIYVVLNRNFHSNVNVLGIFYKQFLTSLYRSTLLVSCKNVQRQSFTIPSNETTIVRRYIKRLLHDIFHIGPGISPRLPYQARQRSWRADMGRGLIPGRIWKISCHNLYVYVALNRNFHSNVNVLGRFYKQVSNVIVQIDIVWYIFETRLETKIFAS
jgi:hypothetical protein